jgi:RHS repeat-associated protein
VPATTYGQVTTFAGSTTQSSGYTNATGTAALFNQPKRMVMDGSGNIYLADGGNNAIRKITPAGVVTTFAGSLTGASGYKDTTAATSALFNNPGGMAIDGSGNLYVSDYNNNAIRKITPSGAVSTFYSQSGMGPSGLCFDGSGNLVVTAQTLRAILKITPAGLSSTIAGGSWGYTNGTGTAAQFENPADAQLDGSGNIIVADYLNNAIRKITPAGVVTTLAGSTVSGNTGAYVDGVGTAARFNNPTGLAITQGGVIYVADFVNHGIRRILPDGTVTLIAGSPAQVVGNTDGTGTAATFHSPLSIYVDNTGTGYVVDVWSSVRKVVLTGYTLKGTLPAGLAFDPTTGTISGTPTGTITTVTDTITAYNASGYSTTYVTFGPAPTITYGGSQSNTFTVGNAIMPITPTVTGNPVPYTGYTTTYAGNGTGASTDGVGTAASFYAPAGLAIDRYGNKYVSDQGTYKIRKISPSNVVTTLAGNGTVGFVNGTGTAAVFNHPVGLATDTAGNIYVADESNNAVRKITPAGVVTTLAGGAQGSADGTGTAAQFYHPTGVAVDVSGNVYVADYLNNRVRKITPAGVVTTFAGSTQGAADGTGTAAQFNGCGDVTVDASGNVYVVDRGNNKIRKITPTGVVSTIAGNGTAGAIDGPAATAEFNAPIALTTDQKGNLYICEYLNDRIRRLDPSGIVSTLAGTGTHGATNGLGSTVTFYTPSAAKFDPWGNLYIPDHSNNLIRQVVTTPYTISPGLPFGLTFDPQTGTISGTPTIASTPTTYTISAYNMMGVGSTTVTIGVTLSLPNNPANDFDKNWIYTRTYDENGQEIGAAKSFYDYNGKATQAQVKNETTGHILASQTLYDVHGRAVAATLTAPTNNSAFAYKNNFVTSDGTTSYSYINFDGDPASATYGKVNNPDGVDKGTIGSLGWYYSNNNTLEPYIAATAYPYSRGDYYRDGSGVANRSAGVGDQLKMGMGHETTSCSFPVQHELDNYLAIRNQFFASAVGAAPVSLAGQALQKVTTDPNGTAVLTITDLAGKQSLMTGRADAAGWLSIQNGFSLTSVRGQYSFNIHLDGPASVQGDTNDPQVIAMMHALILNFGISSNTPVTVTCTNNSNIAPWTGIGSDYVHPLPTLTGTYTFTITSDYPFTVSATNAYGTVYDQAEATYAEPSGSAVQYFQLTSPSTATITGSFSLYNMTSNVDVTSTFTSGTTVLPAGYYKVSALMPAAGNPPNTVTVGYTNKYSDISYNYYNQLGQLIASIAPNGVQQLIKNGYSGITLASQLPFVSLYSYDLQGRLTSVKTPDAGTSNFIYRQDGKIRFSQNAYQANSANAGTGNAEKFSYTNYDDAGRPVESGELAVTSATFVSLSSNATMLESTDPVASTPAGTKLSQINTYYDTPATNLSLTGYVQDPGFLKGAVSYTSNANSTTWYNYDDHGRVTWMVKEIAGLPGYKTVDYTYNDQGSVTKVDYQKSTASERFIHYYAYDADGRLTNVQTSRDDITKIQQANYYYYLHGPLKRVELGDQLQGIDYVYTPQGWLKSINTPTNVASNDPGQDGVNNNFAKDAFGMQMEYFQGDYSRTGSNITSVPTGQQTYYNGNVNGISWQSNKPASVVTSFPNIQNPAMYAYSYDPKYQLTGATWGTPNYSASPSFTAGNTFSEKSMAYDPNGNIAGLQRTNVNGIVSDDFTNGYTYIAGTNQLIKVHDATKNADYASYTYNEIGRLKSETLTGAETPYYLMYNVTGKITGIYSDASMTTVIETYTYDEFGNRIKTTNANGSTYYVYDANDNVLAMYTGTSPSIAETPFYSSGSRLGTYFFGGANYQYELQDIVGSVRVVMNRAKNTSGQADIVTFDDYYPYGSVAQSGGSSYRYDYQGAYSDKDPITGWNNFQLRMYDGKIGRWLGTDPAGQFASPYVGMANNPVTGVDPTGAWHFDKNGNLVADPGDDAASLSQRFPAISLDQAYSITQDLSNWNNGGLMKSGLGADWNNSYLNSNTTFQSGEFTMQISNLNPANTPTDQGTISTFKPAWYFAHFYNLEHGGVIGKFAYNVYDAPFVYLTHLTGRWGDGIHIDGSSANRTEVIDAGVSTISSLLPVGQATKSIVGDVKVLNAAQFNVLYKGTGISARTPGAVAAYNASIKSGVGLVEDFSQITDDVNNLNNAYHSMTAK